jgi:hypothetical protein
MYVKLAVAGLLVSVMMYSWMGVRLHSNIGILRSYSVVGLQPFVDREDGEYIAAIGATSSSSELFRS